MQKRVTIREQLGLKQEELALLLKVTRSQLAMYELGKRDLSVAAKKQLTEMLQYVQSNDDTLKQTKILRNNEALQKKKIAKVLLKTNLHKQMIVDKKLLVQERKFQASIISMNLLGYFEMQSQKKEDQTHFMIKNINAKSNKVMDKSNLEAFTKLQIQKEVLEAEKKVLERFLQKL